MPQGKQCFTPAIASANPNCLHTSFMQFYAFSPAYPYQFIKYTIPSAHFANNFIHVVQNIRYSQT